MGECGQPSAIITNFPFAIKQSSFKIINLKDNKCIDSAAFPITPDFKDPIGGEISAKMPYFKNRPGGEEQKEDQNVTKIVNKVDVAYLRSQKHKDLG